MDQDTVVYLENPWSGHVSTMTWEEVQKWANENVHVEDRADWLDAAFRAAVHEDAKTLGAMIIGS